MTLRDAQVLHLIGRAAQFSGLLLSCAGFLFSCPASTSWYERIGIALAGGLLGYETFGTLANGAGYFFESLPIQLQISAGNVLVAGAGRTIGFLLGAIVGRLIGGPMLMVIGSIVLRWTLGLLAWHLLEDQLRVKGVKVHLKGKDAEYSVLDILGSPKQGMSTVYVATGLPYKSLRVRNCVLKTLDDYNLLRDEAHVWINLGTHPFIVTLLWVDVIDGCPYLVLEYVEPDKKGRNSLGDFLVAPLPLATSLQWATEICSAMAYAFEEKGLVAHRDLKPSNILITADHHVKITDFGLSLASASGLTRKHPSPRVSAFPGDRTDGMVGAAGGGTPPWMAPEQFRGIANQRSDIFSFGIVLWQMAAGKLQSPFYLPYREDSEDWEDWCQRTLELILATECLPLVESPLEPIIIECTRRDPNERYQAFSQILGDLKELRQGTVGSNRFLQPRNRDVQDRQDS